jgi:hypothetical protein
MPFPILLPNTLTVCRHRVQWQDPPPTPSQWNLTEPANLDDEPMCVSAVDNPVLPEWHSKEASGPIREDVQLQQVDLSMLGIVFSGGIIMAWWACL